MPTDRDKPATIDYHQPNTPPPVTIGERVCVICGYVLLATGLLLVFTALHGRTVGDNPRLRAGLIVLAVGAGVTIFCFIYNAIRRM